MYSKSDVVRNKENQKFFVRKRRKSLENEGSVGVVDMQPLQYDPQRRVFVTKKSDLKARIKGSKASAMINGTKDVYIERIKHLNPCIVEDDPRKERKPDLGSGRRFVGFDAITISIYSLLTFNIQAHEIPDRSVSHDNPERDTRHNRNRRFAQGLRERDEARGQHHAGHHRRQTPPPDDPPSGDEEPQRLAFNVGQPRSNRGNHYSRGERESARSNRRSARR